MSSNTWVWGKFSVYKQTHKHLALNSKNIISTCCCFSVVCMQNELCAWAEFLFSIPPLTSSWSSKKNKAVLVSCQHDKIQGNECHSCIHLWWPSTVGVKKIWKYTSSSIKIKSAEQTEQSSKKLQFRQVYVLVCFPGAMNTRLLGEPGRCLQYSEFCRQCRNSSHPLY